ncbi:hypothetical protein KI387_042637, partial [Taxus chinensis]
DARIERLALGQERLANTMARLIHTIQGSNGGRISSKEVMNSPSSKGSNIGTWYEEYRALPEKIRDALPFAEFVKLETERVGIGTGSKPQATRKGSTLPRDPTLKSMDVVHEEGLEGRGVSNPHDKFLNFNSHPHAGEKSDLHFERNGAMKDEDSALDPIIVPNRHHYEVIVHHCLTNTDNISACVDSRIEKEDGEQVGEEKGMIGNHFSKRRVNNQLAGLFRTAAPKSQVEGVHGLGKDHKETPCMCQQGMNEIKMETEDGHAYFPKDKEEDRLQQL